MTTPTAAEALAALEALDDYARMETGVDAIGPRGVLQAYIEHTAKAEAVLRELVKADEPSGCQRDFYAQSKRHTAAWQAAREWAKEQTP